MIFSDFENLVQFQKIFWIFQKKMPLNGAQMRQTPKICFLKIEWKGGGGGFEWGTRNPRPPLRTSGMH